MNVKELKTQMTQAMNGYYLPHGFKKKANGYYFENSFLKLTVYWYFTSYVNYNVDFGVVVDIPELQKLLQKYSESEVYYFFAQRRQATEVVVYKTLPVDRYELTGDMTCEKLVELYGDMFFHEIFPTYSVIDDYHKLYVYLKYLFDTHPDAGSHTNLATLLILVKMFDNGYEVFRDHLFTHNRSLVSFKSEMIKMFDSIPAVELYKLRDAHR